MASIASRQMRRGGVGGHAGIAPVSCTALVLGAAANADTTPVIRHDSCDAPTRPRGAMVRRRVRHTMHEPIQLDRSHAVGAIERQSLLRVVCGVATCVACCACVRSGVTLSAVTHLVVHTPRFAQSRKASEGRRDVIS